jgi:hypothetical protein
MKNILDYYTIPSRFFSSLGKGFFDIVFNPIREAERNAVTLERELKNKLEPLYKLSNKQAERVGIYGMRKQGIKIPFAEKEIKLTPKERKAYIAARQLTEQLYPQVKRIATKFGKELNKIPNYLPLRKKEDIRILNYGSLYEIVRRDPFFGSLLPREENVPFALYELNLKKVMDSWIKSASRYISMAEKANEIKYLIESEGFEGLTPIKIHDKILDWYTYTVNTPAIKGADRILRLARIAQGSYILGGLYTVPVKQFLNLIDAGVMISAKDLAGVIPEVLKQNTALARYVWQSPAIRERALDVTIMDLGGAYLDAIRAPATWTDKLTAVIIKASLMRKKFIDLEKIGEPMTPKLFKEVDDFSTQIVDAIMSGISKSETPEAMRTELGKNVNMFYSQLNAKVQWHLTDIMGKKYKRLWEELPQNHKLAIVKSLVALLVAAYLEKIIEDLYFEDDPKEIVKDVLYHLAGNFPLLGPVVFALKTGQPYSIAPILGHGTRFIMEGSRVVAAEKEKTKIEHLKMMALLSFGFFGVPKQLLNTIEGAVIVAKGKTKVKGKVVRIEDFWDKLLTIIRGKYGSRKVKMILEGRKKKVPKTILNPDVTEEDVNYIESLNLK